MILLWMQVGFVCCDGIRIPSMKKYRFGVVSCEICDIGM